MARTKGSKNKSSLELEVLQQRVYELEKETNSYSETIDAFTEGFVIDLFNKDVIKTVSMDKLQEWFNNPDENMQKIISLLTYYYIIDGNIFQLYDLIFSLPTLEYRINTFDKDNHYKEDMIKIKYCLEKEIKHKDLTRDLIIQLAHEGTLLGTWLKNGSKNYFYVFDNLQYIYPYGRYKGEMVGVIDLEWLDDKSDEERESIFDNLSPLVTKRKYLKYKNDTNNKNNKYILLPTDKSLVARIHTLSRNQRLGVPFGTQAIFDIQHKQKLKDLEKAIANKIIKAIAVLKFQGKDDNDIKVKKGEKQKVYKGVKKALEKNSNDKDGITCIAIPDFASFDFPEMKNGDKALDPKKYESIDGDITNATSISNVLTNGTKGNYASANLNLNVLYSKIGILLEQVEEIYNQLIILLLGERGKNYTFEYIKEPPLSREKKLDVLKNLQTQGYATKYLLDMIGVNADEYYSESIYEIEELELRDKIIPPMSSYTMSGKDDDGIGRPKNENPENENTVTSKENDGNSNPKPNK